VALANPTTVAQVRNNLALALDGQGKFEDAERELRGVLEIKTRRLGADHPAVAMSQNNLALVLGKQERWDEAEAMHRAALELRQKVLSEEHPDVAQSRNNLALLLVQRERYAEAAELAELAWPRRQADDVPANERADTAFILARALWELGDESDRRKRARALATDAYETMVKAEGECAGTCLEMKDWLDTHSL
jgi:tetratricopeptide (TPR) repeat protein